jgi:ferredoxin
VKQRWWHRFIRPSSLAFIREGHHVPGYSAVKLLHGYIYARWPYLYIGIGTGNHPVARIFGPLVSGAATFFARFPSFRKSRSHDGSLTFADTYHGKVVPLSGASQLIQVNEEIQLTDLERVIPYRAAKDIILKNPDHIVALECPCRSARPDPCLPLDVCLLVGEPFASFVLEHHPSRSRAITRDEALNILRAEDERGHVHHAFFKQAMLDRFYAICNCCACCCGAIQAHRRGTPMLASSGFMARVDVAECIGCEDCLEACQFGALSLDLNVSRVNPQECMGCGVCVSRCPQGALSLERTTEKGMPLEISALIEMMEH